MYIKEYIFGQPCKQGRSPSAACGSQGYPKKYIFFEWVCMFLYLATPIKKYLATPNKFIC